MADSPLAQFSDEAKARLYATAARFLERHEDATVVQAFQFAILEELLIYGHPSAASATPKGILGWTGRPK